MRADPNQIEQVILNLGVNARDAMPKGGRLTIRTDNVQFDDAAARRARARPARPGRTCCWRSPTPGHGMDDEVKSRIFEPFFTTKGPGKGTGLGLATVYGVVKQSGGTTTVESAPGEGTTFRIYLPMEAGEVDEIAAQDGRRPSSRRRAGRRRCSSWRTRRSCANWSARCSRNTATTCCAPPNGTEALRMSSESTHGQIALLITDVVMPQMGGLELSRRLTALRPDLKVLYVSGYSEDDMNEQGVLSPDVEFLEKPFTPQAIARKVQEILTGAPSLAEAGVRVADLDGADGRGEVAAGRPEGRG